MLTQETKRKIDSARDILVGKVPDPKAQVEQITTALIYKFMDDMDKGSQELGGKARFFTGGFEKYSWTKLMDPKLGGHDRMDLYVETLAKLSLNPNIPQLFRDIFKDTFLPYRSPETLSLFLKEINGFTYEHSEDLGDSFEYLLSVLGSQGDAGQFRTPRHIIDFIVEAIDPKKTDTVCDPACGTAGFLISAYKHILKQHDGKDDPENKEKPLTPDERKNLMEHFTGYDISPDMVRLSRVNLYLHGFPSPTIYEYDTLSSEEKWDESFDVMLANPPFMTPKGGIKPHKRFSVQANRSEVLFVDYILEHLRPNGRAGIIVPEGIIFQSANAYKALRKLLVEDGLFTVVSLPSGVFNPYAGVKTCILLFDKSLAKKTNQILFVKISNDGFDLGAQRRPVLGNELPMALEAIKGYKEYLKRNNNVDSGDNIPEVDTNPLCHLVAKVKIAESGDYNLSGDRYKEATERANQKWPMVELVDICQKITDGTHNSPKYSSSGIPMLDSKNINNGFIDDTNPQKFISRETDNELSKRCKPKAGDILVSSRGSIGKLAIVRKNQDFNIMGNIILLRPSQKVIPEYLFSILSNINLENSSHGVAQKGLYLGKIKKIKIPLPPIEVQKEIVEQIEIKQQAIEHAKAIIKNLERERAYFGQSLRRLSSIEILKLGDICKNMDSKRKPVTKSLRKNGEYPYYGASGIVDYVEDYIFDGNYLLVSEDGANLVARSTPIAFSIAGKSWVNNHAHVLKFKHFETQKFVEYYLNSIDLKDYITGSAQPKLNQNNLNKIQIPLPPQEVQKQMITEVEHEEEIATANRRLIELYEQKIADVISAI